jgi:two-component system phosphate regulon sensor histidine kinase PhoR
MTGLPPRLAGGLLALALGALGGFLFRGEAGLLLGALAGGTIGFATIVVVDAIRGWRLMHWLRGPREGSAPRDAGFWGELAYRIEKAFGGLERQAEAERLRLAQFVSAMEASPNGVLLLDATDQIEWCNTRAADHFGLDRQRVTNLIRSPAFVEALQGGEFTDPVMVRDPQRQSTLQVSIRRYGDHAKLVISQDMTERERADAMRRDFVANVSHEIRTPLTVLTGFLETLRNLPLSEAEQKRVLLLMSQQADRMGNLVDDLLILARLEGSPRPNSDRWVRVAGLFAQVESEARALSAGRHALNFGSPGEAQIAGVESELLSAITNLVNNAVRYTPDGGRIDVRWRVDDRGVGEISVSDTGRGIAREHLPRLTERFYRVDGSRSRESGGTGLGLAIVKHVAQRHGGELDVASEVGKGSTFRLLFPAVRTRDGGEEPASAPIDRTVVDTR